MLLNKELLVFHFISLILFITLKYKTSSVACLGVALISGSERHQFGMQKTILTSQN